MKSILAIFLFSVLTSAASFGQNKDVTKVLNTDKSKFSSNNIHLYIQKKR